MTHISILIILNAFIGINFVNSDICPTELKISLTTIDAPLPEEDAEKAIIWLEPHDGKQTVLLSSGHSIWRSVDQGRNWQNITDSFPGSNLFQAIALSPDNKTVIVTGFNNNIWNSFDYGMTFHPVSGPCILGDLKFHPFNPDWLLGICTGKLYLSQDYGSNWALIRENVFVADWHGGSSDEKMIVTWENGDLMKSLTFFRTEPTKIATGVLGYKSIKNKIFFATYGSKGLILNVSEDFGETSYVVRFPLGLSEHRYTLLDTSEGLTFVNIQHSEENSWGNLYASNAFDTDFSLSLENNARTPMGKCDFQSVAGIEGIYLANKYASVTGPNQVGTEKQTVITYDKGGKWNRLSTPSGVNCVPKQAGDCSLNLLGISDSGTWFSRKEATGLILALGSVSQYLINKDPEVGLFVSRDAGWTWKFVASGRYTYEIGNSGSLILAMVNNKETNSIKYSLDEGETWKDCQFADQSVEIRDIVSDPQMRSGLFLAFGSKGEKGVLVSIDFSGIFARQCQGIQTPTDPNSDYEYWQPSDTKGDECLLGRRVQYLRRKISSNCLNPPSFSTIEGNVVKNCSCTEENYECDFCFVEVNNQCVPDTSAACTNYNPKQVPSPCIGAWYESLGYRRVPGDTCDATSGVDHLPIKKFCPTPPTPNGPSQGTQGKPGLLIGFFLVAFICGTIGGVWWYSGQNESLRGILKVCIPEKFLPSPSTTSAPQEYNTVPTVDDLEDDI